MRAIFLIYTGQCVTPKLTSNVQLKALKVRNGQSRTDHLGSLDGVPASTKFLCIYDIQCLLEIN